MKAEQKKKTVIREEAWEVLDNNKYMYQPMFLDKTQQNPIPDRRLKSLLSIFLAIVTPNLLVAVVNGCNDLHPNHWTYSDHKRQAILPTNQRVLYQLLAITIRIYGHQNKPKESDSNDRPLRQELEEQCDYFKTKFGNSRLHNMPGVRTLEYLFARFAISSEFFHLVNANFRSLFASIGDLFAGDEKLLHFTGNSVNILQVLTKPDRIGIWFYEGCIQLSNGLPFLLYISLRNLCNDDINDGAPEKVHYIVKQWVESITHFGINGVLLAFDSYYFSAATQEHLKIGNGHSNVLQMHLY